MNYLQLAQTLHQILRVGQAALGTAPTAVTGQVGIPGELVFFIARAWEDIQNSQPRWRFMVKNGTLVLPQGSVRISTSAISDLDTIILSDSDYRGRFITAYRDSVADEQIIRYISYQDWQQGYLARGERGTGTPSRFTLRPDNQLEFDVLADVAYTLRFDYRRTPQQLVANNDIPIMKSRFHMAIVWWAIHHYYCITRDANDLMAKSGRELKREMQKLLNEELEEVLGFEVGP